MRPVAAEFHHRELDQSDIDYVADDAAELHSIAGLDSKSSDQKEIAGYRKDHVLQGDRDTCSGESHHGRGGSDLIGEVDQQYDKNEQAEREPARRHHLSAPADILHVAIGEKSPYQPTQED